MLYRISWLIMLSALLAGCSAMQPAQPYDLSIEESHLFGVTQLAFSPTDRQIASGGFQGDIAVWDLPSGRQSSRYHRHDESIRGLQWVREHELLSGSEDGRLVISDPTTGALIHQRDTATGLTSLVFLKSSARVIAGYEDGLLRQFTYPGLEADGEVQLGAAVIALAADPASNRLAVSADDKRVWLMDAGLSLLKRLSEPPGRALTLRFSPDGGTLAAGAWYDIYLWDVANDRLRVQETEHWGAVIAIDFDSEGKHLVTLGRHTDASLRLMTVADGDVVRRLQAHRLCGAVVRFSRDGRFIASASDDESIRLYDLAKPYRPQ